MTGVIDRLAMTGVIDVHSRIMMRIIRPVELSDAQALADIFAPHVTDSSTELLPTLASYIEVRA
jgi:hypothetical protein